MSGELLESVSGSRGEYHLDGVLGEGGFGVVYSATAPDGRQVAVKLLRAETLDDRSVERFRKEVTALERLDHPHIARILDSGVHRGRPFLVMQRLAGESLDALLERAGPLAIEQACDMLVAIGGALEHAHARGVIHRDIAPANIVLADGTWWLVDFGLALDLEGGPDARLTSSGVVVGTSAYMSPEQVAGSHRIDGRSDQYSLACVVYHALAGVPPFQGGSAQATRALRLHLDAPELRLHRPGIPLHVGRAIGRALAREPADRFATTGDLARALTAPPARRPRLPSVSRGLRISLGVALAIALLAFAIPRFRRVPPSPGADPLRVAVLFFDDLTPDKSLGWLSRGLTSDLIHDLSGLDTLTVISMSGAQALHDREVGPEAAAQELSVGTLVDGTVRRATDTRLEVTVRVVDASAGFKVHSIRILRPEPEVAALQEQMLFEISTYLREHVGRSTDALRRRQVAPSVAGWRRLQEAEELLVAGWELGRRGEAQRAWTLLGRADSILVATTRLHPQWADPVTMRARVARAQYLAISSTELVPGQRAGAGGNVELALDRIAAGLALAKHALSLAPQNVEAETLRAYFQFSRWVMLGQRAGAPELITARRELEALVTRDKAQALAWVLLSRIYEFNGDTAHSDSAAQRAYAADPFLSEGRRAISDLIGKHLETGRVDNARTLCAGARRRYLDEPELAECHLQILAWTARHPDSVGAGWREIAAVESSNAPGLSTGWMMRRMYVAAIAARAGLTDSAQAIVDAGRSMQGPDRADSTAVALAEAWVATLSGRDSVATQLLASLLRTSADQRARVATHPWFSRLRTQARFRSLAGLE